MAESELVILRSLTPGQPSDRSITNITVQTCISRKIVSSEALSTSVCVTTLRASGWARGADSTARALSIGTRLTLSIISCCAYTLTRLSTCFIASILQEEVSICTPSTGAILRCSAELGPHGISSAVAVQRAWLTSPHFEQYLEPPMTAPQSAQPPVPLLGVHSFTQEPPSLGLVSLVYLRAFPAGQAEH